MQEAFSVDNEMLTQKLSIKRHVVLKKYKPQVRCVSMVLHIIL